MNIIYLTTSFPKSSDGSTIYTDFAEELSKSGHNLIIIVADQTISKKYVKLYDRALLQYRIKIPKYYNVGFFKKGYSLLMQPFYLKKTIKILNLPSDIDVILYEAPPISNMGVVKWLKKNTKAISYLMLKDIFPQNAVDLGIIKNKGLIYSYFRNKETKLYEESDLIGCMSINNMDYVIKHNRVPAEKVKYFPNTKKISEDIIMDLTDIRGKYNIPNDKLVFIFGGNMGMPQYMELHKAALIKYKNNQKIFFAFVGRGNQKSIIEKTISENSINNAIVISEIHRDEYEKLLTSSDVGLITLNPSFTIPNFPSRILSYMEYSKPIIAATDTVSDIKDLILRSKCGIWVDSSKYEDYFNAIDTMIEMDNRKELGLLGRKYLINNFTIEKSVKYFEEHIKEVLTNV